MEPVPSQGDLLHGPTPAPENPTLGGDLLHGPSAPLAGPTPMDRKLGGLCFTLTLAFAGLLLANLGFSVLLIWQTRLVRQQLAQGSQTLLHYQKTEEPLVRDLLSKLEGFGLQNRDYEPILKKHAVLFPRLQPSGSKLPGGVLPSGASVAPSALQPGRK
jgi:hypothetical protein